MGDPALAPDERYCYRHYKTWPNEERWEVIDGIAYSMSPAPTSEHQALVWRLATSLGVFLKGKPCKAYPAPFDVLLPSGDEADDETDTVVQPDIVVICDKSKITPRGARGAPDFVIEILSPRTAKKDYGIKFELYQRHGVREYWIVDPAAEAIHVWALGNDGRYGAEALYEEGERVASSSLEGFFIDAKELFAEQN